MMKFNFRNIILSCLTLVSIGASTTIAAQEYFGGRHAECDPCFPDTGRFTAGADWLYWKTTEDGLNYGQFIDSVTTPTPTGSLTTEGSSILKPNFKWDNGYKVFAGYGLPYYDWELGIIYTHAPSSTATNAEVITSLTQSILLLPNYLFTSSQGGFDLTGVVGTSVASKWTLDLEYIDFDLAHTLHLIESLRVRPHIGVRHLWSKQTFSIAYTGAVPTISTLAYATQMHEKVWATGVEGGLWGDWDIGCGFSLLGHVGGGILYGTYKLNSGLAVLTTPTTGTPTALAEVVHERIHTSIPMLDYFIGIQFAASLFNVEFDFQAGWEQHVVFDANRFTLSENGDLSLQGLTLGATFSF